MQLSYHCATSSSCFASPFTYAPSRLSLPLYFCLPQSMVHAFRLGFHSCLLSRSFAAIPRNLRVGGAVLLKPRAMASERLLSYSSEKMSKSDAIELTSERNVVDDGDAVKRMTVKELRAKLRSLGVPATGRKSDLVSALKSFLNREIDGKDHLAVEDGSLENNSKRKAKGLSSEGKGENISSLLEVSGRKRIQRTRTIVNQVPVEDSVAKVETTIAEPKKELSVKTSEVTGRKSTWARSAEIVSADYRVDPAKNEIEPWTILAHKKPQKGWIPYNPRTMRPPPLTRDTNYVKLMSWNVNGLRALLKLEGFSALQIAQREDFDVLCLQETKLQEKDVEAIKESLLEGYENSFWTCSSTKLGYSGTAIISRIKPLSVKYGLGISDHDSEGRLVTVEFDSYYIINGYVPNAGDGLRRLSYRVTEWDPSLGSYIKDLEKSKPVILTGDLNCAHEEIDIYDPAGNKRSAGFTAEERQSFETNFLNRGFVDTFRKQHPGVVGYTYWGYRHNGRKTNKGWRLDYFLVSESIADNVHDSYILPDVTGSDHSPIGLILKL